ncbi:MAG: ABC transporter permease, partial [Candidatus Adiutrix sp.]|nr:ABC transporter permease [Candidatus Adiutrix sp.]
MTAENKSRRAGLRRSAAGLTLFIAALILWAAAGWLLPAKHRYLFPSPRLTALALWDSLPELLVSTKSSFL